MHNGEEGGQSAEKSMAKSGEKQPKTGFLRGENRAGNRDRGELGNMTNRQKAPRFRFPSTRGSAPLAAPVSAPAFPRGECKGRKLSRLLDVFDTPVGMYPGI